MHFWGVCLGYTMHCQAFGKSLRASEPTLWAYLVLVVNTMVAHDCYDDLQHLTSILKEISSKYPKAAPKVLKLLIEMADQPLEKEEGLSLEKLHTDQVKLLTSGDLYQRYIHERTLRQVSKVREDKAGSAADRRKTVGMLLKSTALNERQLAELQVVSTLLSDNVDDGEKLVYMLEDTTGERHGTFCLWHTAEHPLYKVCSYFVQGEGLWLSCPSNFECLRSALERFRIFKRPLNACDSQRSAFGCVLLHPLRFGVGERR